MLTEHLLSPAGDMFAFGVLVWQMVTGQRPWAGEGERWQAAAEAGKAQPPAVAREAAAHLLFARLHMRASYLPCVSRCAPLTCRSACSMHACVLDTQLLIRSPLARATTPHAGMSHAQIFTAVSMRGLELEWPAVGAQDYDAAALQGLQALGRRCCARARDDRPSAAEALECVLGLLSKTSLVGEL